MQGEQRVGHVLAWSYFILAALSLLFTLNYPFINEEGNYTTLVLDMMQNHHWLQPVLTGMPYPRPPLLSWMAVPWVHWFGYPSALMVMRVLTVCYTVITGGALIWFVKKVMCPSHSLLPILSGCLFLSGGVLFIRGWLAYADPLFALLVFSSMALLFRALEKESSPALFWSLLLVFLGAMTKEPVAYVFYGLTGCALVCARIGTGFAFRWQTLLLGFLGLVVPYLLWHFISEHAHIHSDLSAQAGLIHSWGFFFKRLSGFFAHEFMRYNLVFVVVIVAAIWMDKKVILQDKRQKALLYIITFNLLPYFILSNPGGYVSPRYILPLIPWIAIFAAQILLRTRKNIYTAFLIILWLGLGWKYIMGVGQYKLNRGVFARVADMDSTPLVHQMIKKTDHGRICALGLFGTTINPLEANLDMKIASSMRLVEHYGGFPLPSHCQYFLSERPVSSSDQNWSLLLHKQWGMATHGRPPLQVYFYRRSG